MAKIERKKVKKVSKWAKAKATFLTGTSYMIPVLVVSGFIGGVVGGVACGFMVLYLKKLKVPSWFSGPMNIIIIPLATSFVIGMILYYVVGGPIAWAMGLLTNWLVTLQGGSRFLLGAVMGGCWGIDFGGPITQTAAAFANALNAEGVYAPSAVKMAAGMAPPISMALATFLQRKKFKRGDVENAKVGVTLGCFYITEGALPFFLNDPVRVWISTIPGCALGGGLSMLFGVESPALHGGIFAIPLMNKPLLFILALCCNIITSGIIYSIIKKPLPLSEQDYKKKAA